MPPDARSFSTRGVACASLRAAIPGLTRDTGVRGASVALLRGGRVVWLEGFGVRDERSGEPVTTGTVFQTASLGKVVAAYGALLRVEDGDWSLEMPAVSPRLRVGPGCPPPDLAALLSHSAGLGNDLSAEHFEAACTPPASFAYAGQGYLVLQDLFGDASGRAAESFLRARIFEPLGMSGATFAQPGGTDVATGHADLLYGALADKALGGERGWAAALAAVALGGLVVLARRTWRAHPPVRASFLVLCETVGLAAVAIALLAFRVVPVAPWSTDVLLPSSLHASAEDMARFASELLRPKLARADTARSGTSTSSPWKPGLQPIQDNTLYEPIQQDSFEDRSNGAGKWMFTGRTKDAKNAANQIAVRRAVVVFDIAGSGIPAGSTIDSAKTLHQGQEQLQLQRPPARAAARLGRGHVRHRQLAAGPGCHADDR